MSVKIKISVPLNIWKICCIEYSWSGKSVFIPLNQSSILTAAATSGSGVGWGWDLHQGLADPAHHPARAAWACMPDWPCACSHVHNLTDPLWGFGRIYLLEGNLVCFCLLSEKLAPQCNNTLSQDETLTADALRCQAQSVLTSDPRGDRSGCAHSPVCSGDVGISTNH